MSVEILHLMLNLDIQPFDLLTYLVHLSPWLGVELVYILS